MVNPPSSRSGNIEFGGLRRGRAALEAMAGVRRATRSRDQGCTTPSTIDLAADLDKRKYRRRRCLFGVELPCWSLSGEWTLRSSTIDRSRLRSVGPRWTTTPVRIPQTRTESQPGLFCPDQSTSGPGPAPPRAWSRPRSHLPSPGATRRRPRPARRRAPRRTDRRAPAGRDHGRSAPARRGRRPG
jgi:hypothetical protein